MQSISIIPTFFVTDPILEGHLIPDNIRTKMTEHMELHLVYKLIVP